MGGGAAAVTQVGDDRSASIVAGSESDPRAFSVDSLAMPSLSQFSPGRRLATVVAAGLLVLLLPLSTSAHSELKSSDPAEGASVPSPFSGPVVLTFSEALADGSKADLVAPDGATVASATVDAAGATMTFSLSAPLAPGGYQAKWTSIADDGDLLRGIVTFTVAAATPSSTPEPSEAATPSASPATSGDSGGSSDVVLPIAIAVIFAAAGAFYLIRRNRPA